MVEAAMQGVQEVTNYPPGVFSWADLLTNDIDDAKRFYGALFGWTFEDSPMGEGMFYTFAKRYDKIVAGLMGIPGVSPTWQSYVTVEDADALAAKVREAGGTVEQEPVDVYDNGRMVSVRDTGGHAIAGWQPYNFAGSGLAQGPGVPVWHELWTEGDLETEMEFYRKVFGWSGQMQENDGLTHIPCFNGEAPVTLLLPNDGKFGEAPSGWIVYFGSADVPADAAKVQELGGTVLFGPTVMSGYPFATCRDPQGAVFLIMSGPAPA